MSGRDSHGHRVPRNGFPVPPELPLLAERFVRAVRDRVVPENVRGFNYDVVDGARADASRILAAATTLPMMATSPRV